MLVDRHGRPRYYFRKAGHKSVALPDLPWSPKFMEAHSAAMNQVAPLVIGASRMVPGTINALTDAYFNSSAFRALSASTQATYRNIIERFRNEHGEKRVGLLERAHIVAMIGKKTTTPAVANNFLRMVRILMQFVVVEGIRRDDPTVGIKAIKNRSEGFHTWSESEIATFEARHSAPAGVRLDALHRPKARRRRADGAASTSVMACCASANRRREC
jgi:hypothetical protein